MGNTSNLFENLQIKLCLDCRETNEFPLLQVKQLDAAYFQPVWGPRQWALLENASRRLFCLWCQKEDKVVSYILGELNQLDQSFEIFKVITIPEMRQKGIASKLYQRLISSIEDFGVNKVFLQVAQNNHAALSAYTSWGFQSLRVIRDYYGRGNDAQELQHCLNQL